MADDKMVGRPIFRALAKVKSELQAVIAATQTAEVDSEKGRGYNYQYATLADILGLVTPVLANHGIVLTQTFHILTTSGEMVWTLRTALHHDSSDEIESMYPLPDPRSERAQQMGSLITYARRYSALAILGMAVESEDDDANEADQNQAVTRPRTDKPACPACGQTKPVLRSKYPDADWFCYEKLGGCGEKWFAPVDTTQPTERGAGVPASGGAPAPAANGLGPCPKCHKQGTLKRYGSQIACNPKEGGCGHTYPAAGGRTVNAAEQKALRELLASMGYQTLAEIQPLILHAAPLAKKSPNGSVMLASLTILEHAAVMKHLQEVKSGHAPPEPENDPNADPEAY